MFWSCADVSFQSSVHSSLPKDICKTWALRPASSALFDVCIAIPGLYFPAFYALQNQMKGNMPILENTKQYYKQNIRSDVKANASIWFPLHLVNFTFIPQAYRGYVSACGGFIWAAYLSYVKQ